MSELSTPISSQEILSQGVFRMVGAVQHYAWGGFELIPELLNVPNPEQKPFAELWMGAHIKGPASIQFESHTIGLNELIDTYPEEILGKRIADQFDNKLPFLFKVLDVKEMLSIQSHPTKDAAVEGFKKENLLGIDLKAFERTYRDDNHKPEVMVALTEFWLLHGFKSEDDIRKQLKKYQEFSFLLDKLDEGLPALYRHIMEMEPETVNQVLTPLLNRLSTEFDSYQYGKADPEYWAVLGHRTHSTQEKVDKGIFSIFLLNLVKLNEGEGIFQAAGIPHAYLEGANIELMANSDNVFRGGLTKKLVNVPELMKHLSFEPVIPKALEGKKTSQDSETHFPTPVPDFDLYKIELKADTWYENADVHGPEAILVMKGSIYIHTHQELIELRKGESFFAIADAYYTIQAKTDCQLFKAGVPIPE